MTETMTMMDAIVLLAVVFAMVFFAAWLISPGLRAWIERPKYRFLADVQRYDETRGTEAKAPDEPHHISIT